VFLAEGTAGGGRTQEQASQGGGLQRNTGHIRGGRRPVGERDQGRKATVARGVLGQPAKGEALGAAGQIGCWRQGRVAKGVAAQDRVRQTATVHART